MLCDHCANNEYDEEDECWYCGVNMDEDDYYCFLTGGSRSCPFYRSDDEYEVVRHQM